MKNPRHKFFSLNVTNFLSKLGEKVSSFLINLYLINKKRLDCFWRLTLQNHPSISLCRFSSGYPSRNFFYSYVCQGLGVIGKLILKAELITSDRD